MRTGCAHGTSSVGLGAKVSRDVGMTVLMLQFCSVMGMKQGQKGDLQQHCGIMAGEDGRGSGCK